MKFLLIGLVVLGVALYFLVKPGNKNETQYPDRNADSNDTMQP